MTQPTYKKKLIEVAIPLEAINKGSAYEKLPGIGPHPRGIHLWWARRPHVACRSILFAQLVDDPSSHPEKFPTEEEQQKERERLFKIIIDLADWKNSTNEQVLKHAQHEIEKNCDNHPPSIFDPFSGGGSIPSEAQRLGLSAHGSDLNPVAVLIAKAMIEIPPRFKGNKPVHESGPEKLHYKHADGLAEDVRYYGQWMRNRAKEMIGGLYPEVTLPEDRGGGKMRVINWLWVRTVPSPDPAYSGTAVPLASSFLLRSKKGKEVWVEPVVNRVEKSYDFRICSGPNKDAIKIAKKGTKAGQATFRCLFSEAAISGDYINKVAENGQLGVRLMAVVADGKRERVYLEPDETQLSFAQEKTEKYIQKNNLDHKFPEEKCRGTFASNAQGRRYGFNQFQDYFTKRQLVALTTFGDLIPDVVNKIREDALIAGMSDDPTPLRNDGDGAYAYAEAISVYLAFAIDRAADFNNSLTGWRSANEKIMYLFSRQAIPMVWDFGEANILGEGVGSFHGIVSYQSKCIEKLFFDNDGTSSQLNAIDVQYPKNSVVSTDPPYYDNIEYAALSDFFYVWMRRNLKAIYPDIFDNLLVPKAEELVATTYRHGTKEKAEAFFLNGMTQAIHNITAQVSSEYPITIYYAFKQSEIEQEGISSTGWATFLQAVLSANLSIVGTWPIRSEQTYRMVASGTNALATSVVLVCRKRDTDAETVTRAEFIRALKQELPLAMHELQRSNITPVDMPQASIGPGIGVFSRYKSVLESDDSPMTVKTALQIINRELDAFLTEQEGEFDADTRFAVTWFEQHGLKAGGFGDADNLARARGLSVDSVKHAGIVESTASKVRLLPRDELDDDWTPAKDSHLTIWECTQYLIRALQEDGEYAAAKLLKQMGSENAEAARDLAYRLFDICDKQGQAKEASAYNSLIAIWSDLTAQAATITDAQLGDSQMSML